MFVNLIMFSSCPVWWHTGLGWLLEMMEIYQKPETYLDQPCPFQHTYHEACKWSDLSYYRLDVGELSCHRWLGIMLPEIYLGFSLSLEPVCILIFNLSLIFGSLYVPVWQSICVHKQTDILFIQRIYHAQGKMNWNFFYISYICW